jgi:guanylate kinase
VIALPAGNARGAATIDGAALAAGSTTAARRHSRLTVLSGPSGVGKGTVTAQLRGMYPEIWISVSVTTRNPRPGEVNGREYYFVDDLEFDRMVAGGEFLEWDRHFGGKYGTPRKPVESRLEAGEPALLEIDLAGARQVRQSMPDALFVFLSPPSWEELVRRLTGRGTEPPGGLADRLARAKVELAAGSEFDITLVNTSVQYVCRRMVTLIDINR